MLKYCTSVQNMKINSFIQNRAQMILILIPYYPQFCVKRKNGNCYMAHHFTLVTVCFLMAFTKVEMIQL